mmetsp:Transcript_40531/g.107274  ORF Transcript_40531/g.107274 Transcript_40531/m.107274 type:complete len:218 (-) Transcript_40531:92-745(-)
MQRAPQVWKNAQHTHPCRPRPARACAPPRSEVRVSVAVRRVVAHRICVLLVFHVCVIRKRHDRAHRVADLHAHAARVRRPIPNREDVLLVAHREHTAADLVAHAKLTTEDGEQNVLPVACREAFLEPHDPFATVDVGLVLPHGANTLSEDVVIAHGRALIDWPPQVHIQAPEVLNRARGPECECVLLVRFIGDLLEVRESPRIGKRVCFLRHLLATN